MAFTWGPQVITSHEAAANIGEGVIVKLTAQGVRPVAATTDVPFGLSTEAVTATHTGRILHLGVDKMRAGAAIAVGTLVSFNANGEAIAATAGATIIGTAFEAASGAGEYIAVGLSTFGAGTVAA